MRAALLAQCGHFNRYAALFCPFNWDPAAQQGDEGALGGRLTPEMEAIVIQVSLSAVLTICVVTKVADPGNRRRRPRPVRRADQPSRRDTRLGASHSRHRWRSRSGRTVPAPTGRRRRPTDTMASGPRGGRAPGGTPIEAVRTASCRFFDVASGAARGLTPDAAADQPLAVRRRIFTRVGFVGEHRTLAHETNVTSIRGVRSTPASSKRAQSGSGPLR